MLSILRHFYIDSKSRVLYIELLCFIDVLTKPINLNIIF